MRPTRKKLRRNDVARANALVLRGALKGLRVRPGRSGALRRRLALLLCALFLAGFSCDRKGKLPPAAPGLQPAETATARQPVFLWRAQLGSSTLYMLGSVHVARADLYPLDPRIEAAFAESDTLVLELALDEAAQLGAAQRMMELGRLDPGVRLADVVRPETYELLVETQERHGASLFGLRGFRPWFVALGLTTQALEREGFSASLGIDEHFRRKAEARRGRIVALETVDEQLALFTGLPPEAEEQLLRQTLEEIDDYGAELAATFRAWSKGDAAAMDRLLIGPMRQQYPALFAQLFTQRNQAMVQDLLELAETPGRYFVVVGAGHLVGNSGIVDLLRSRGIVSMQL